MGLAATGGRAMRLQEARRPNAVAKHTWEVATRVIAHLGLIATWESTQNINLEGSEREGL